MKRKVKRKAEIIANCLSLSLYDVLGKRRKHHLVEARFIMFYFLNQDGYTRAEIAQNFRKSRNAVYHGLEQFNNWMLVDKEFKKKVTTINNVINESAN